MKKIVREHYSRKDKEQVKKILRKQRMSLKNIRWKKFLYLIQNVA